MAEKKQERVSIFIDGSNLYHIVEDFNSSTCEPQKSFIVFGAQKISKIFLELES